MRNEKNRLDETEFVERGNEDFYFAAKDRALLQEMKTETRKVEATMRQERAATCPKCGGKFVVYSFMDFVLDRCESCEGIWLDKGELEGILRRAARGPLGAFLDRCFSKFDRKLSI